MKNNNSYINNATLSFINNSALIIARVFNGKVTRNDTTGKDNNVFSDDELTKYHDSIYIARVDFSEEKHNALEITATAKQFYVAYGDTLSNDIINALSLKESATATERKEKWNMKNKALFSVDTLKEIVARVTESATTEKKESAKKETTAKQTTKKKESAKKESAKKTA